MSKQGNKRAKFEGNNCAIKSVCFSRTASHQHQVVIISLFVFWDVKNGQQKRYSWMVILVLSSQSASLLMVPHQHHAVVIIPSVFGMSKQDGKIAGFMVIPVSLLIALYQLQARSDDKTSQQKTRLNGHTNAVWSVCFSHDGTKLASGSGDNSIHIWDVDEAKVLQITDNLQTKQLQQTRQKESSSFLQNSVRNTTVLEQLVFQAQDALIQKGEFINYLGVNLQSFLLKKGSVAVNSQLKL